MTEISFTYSIGEYFARKLVNQVDLAPSIAAIFEAGIPENRYVEILVGHALALRRQNGKS